MFVVVESGQGIKRAIERTYCGFIISLFIPPPHYTQQRGVIQVIFSLLKYVLITLRGKEILNVYNWRTCTTAMGLVLRRE